LAIGKSSNQAAFLSLLCVAELGNLLLKDMTVP